MNSKNPRVVVVGAGIVGSSVAYHLARQNAYVILIDKAPRPGHAVTDKSFAWITAAHNAPDSYFNLKQQAIIDWRRIENELNGRLTVNWAGALTWHKHIADTERIGSNLQKFNDKIRLLPKKEICLLEPNLKHPPDLAIYAENEGAIDPRLTTQTLVNAAKEAGADIQLDNEALSFITDGSKVNGIMTVNGRIKADVVVLATGVNAVKLCQLLNLALPINASPAILMQFQNDHRFVNRIVSNPLMEIRAASDTILLGAEDYIDESTENNPQAIAKRTLMNIKNYWQGSDQLKLIDVLVGQRPMPQDGLPIIGRTNISGLYLTVMHTGITLAPIVGRLAASEILSDNDDPLLASFRLKRFITK